jgi:hypothetical protein
VEDPKTSRALKVATKASTTAELLADRPAIADAAATLASGKTTEVAELALLSARDRAEQCRRPDGELPHAREGLRLRPEQKWDVFFRREAKNPRYFQNGDVIAARIATDDEQSTSANREIESTTRDDRRNPERGAALDSPLAAPQRTGRKLARSCRRQLPSGSPGVEHPDHAHLRRTQGARHPGGECDIASRDHPHGCRRHPHPEHQRAHPRDADVHRR